MANPAGTIAQFTDHEGRVSRFLEQFKNKTKLDKLLRSYLKQIQEIEDAAFEVMLERVVDVAVGVQLTVIGKIAGQPRTTSVDEDYRTMIRARIAINLSNGTPEDLIAILVLILVGGEKFKVKEESPAQFRITVTDPLPAGYNPKLIHSLLTLADAAGCRLLFEHHLTPGSEGFASVVG